MAEFINREQLPVFTVAPEKVRVLFERATPVDFNDLHSVAGAALRMPAIVADDIRAGTIQATQNPIALNDVEVPMGRVVGIRSMPGWSGRGLDASGDAHQNGGYSSLTGIAYYGKKGQSGEYSSGSAPHLFAFTDSTGEVWFMGRNDGSHRIAAAKLSGDGTLRHADVAWADVLPKVNFSVPEVLSLRKRYHNSLVGKLVLSGTSKKLVAASIKLDGHLAAERQMLEGLGGEFWL